MDLYDMLREDHREVSRMLGELESITRKRRKALFLEVQDKVKLHFLVEEKHFYPALTHTGVAHDITLEAYEEHRLVELLLEELDDMNAESDEWVARLKVLKENIERHVREEEDEMFPRAQQSLSEEQAQQIGASIVTEKAEQMALKP